MSLIKLVKEKINLEKISSTAIELKVKSCVFNRRHHRYQKQVAWPGCGKQEKELSVHLKAEIEINQYFAKISP
jgi:hypothetical protein